MPLAGVDMKASDAKSSAPAILGAVVGLTLSIGPALAAHLFPRAASIRMLGACVLGGLVTLSACRWR